MNRHHQTAAYLLKASNFLPNNAQYKSVRSHLISKCKELMKRPLDNLQRCTACGTNFKDVLPNHQIKPVSVPNRFQRRQLRDEDYKTKYQALRMKQFHKKIYNQQKLVTVCKMCKKTHTTQLTKPPNILTTKVIKQVSKNKKKNEKKKLKRLQKNKSREFAGLNESVVRSVVNDLKNCSSPKSDTDSPEPSTSGDNSFNVGDRLCDSPIIICDSPTKSLHSDSVIELSENETDTSVISISSPNSENSKSDSDIFFIDTNPTTSSNESKKLNKLALANSMKSSNSKVTPLTPSATWNSNRNVNQVNKNQSPKLSKKQKKLLKPNNSNLSSTLVTEIVNTPKQNVVKNKNKKNKILAQPMKKDKKSQKLNCLANLLNNNDGTRTKSTSMLSEFLKTIT